ncbi:MAG: hypothetical protein PHH49_04690 [Candidatus Omnitrophica bacterium]|nr:hypothetical protein [Candidatus Omnitrophota bacterium]MDD5488243.1 hypothetical protein [Candidatus Omnitrophota bacterium]
MGRMFKDKISRMIGMIEIFIGTVTFLVCTAVQFFKISNMTAKPTGVFVFVAISAIIALVLGGGILCERKWAKKYLMYFSGYVIMLKVMAYMGVISMKGPIFVVFPLWIKDIISIVYHLAVIYFLSGITFTKS